MRIPIRIVCILAVIAAMAPAAWPQTKPPARKPRPAASAPEPRPASQEEDKQAIAELHQRDIAASLAFDVEKLVSLWDADIVSMPPSMPPVAGIEANRALLMRNRAKMADVDILGYEQQWDEVRIVGEFAFEYGSIRSRLRAADAKQETALAFNVMRVLKRQPDGAWKVFRTIWNDRQAPEPPTPAPRKEEEKPKP